MSAKYGQKRRRMSRSPRERKQREAELRVMVPMSYREVELEDLGQDFTRFKVRVGNGEILEAWPFGSGTWMTARVKNPDRIKVGQRLQMVTEWEPNYELMYRVTSVSGIQTGKFLELVDALASQAEMEGGAK